MKKSDYPCKCSKCGKMFDNLAAFVEHNKECGSFGYDIIPGAVKVSKVENALKSAPKDIQTDALRDEMPKTDVKIVKAKAPRVKGGKK